MTDETRRYFINRKGTLLGERDRQRAMRKAKPTGRQCHVSINYSRLAIEAELGTDSMALNRLPVTACPERGDDETNISSVCDHGVEITWNQVVDLDQADTDAVMIEYAISHGAGRRLVYAIEPEPAVPEMVQLPLLFDAA